MCQACRTAKRRKGELGELATAHRLIEQTLSWLGFLRPRDCRAKGGAPKKVLTTVLVNLKGVYDAFEAALADDLRDKNGVVDWDAVGLKAAAARFEYDLEAELIKAVDAAIDAGLADAADALGEPDIVFTKVDGAIVENLKSQTINLCAKTAAKVHGDIQGQLLESQRLGENMFQAMERIKSISSLSDYEIERICRTELSKAANAARLQGYKGRVEKVEWVLGPAYNGGCGCGDLAGVHTLEEALGLQMPLHPNCDCYWLPVVDL